MTNFTIELPYVHPSLNKWTRMHYILRNNLKQSIQNDVWKAAKVSKIPKIDSCVEIFITYYHPRRTVDLDNYTPKFFLDGLKHLFVDDNIQHVIKLGWTFKKDKNKRSIIEVIPVKSV